MIVTHRDGSGAWSLLLLWGIVGLLLSTACVRPAGELTAVSTPPTTATVPLQPTPTLAPSHTPVPATPAPTLPGTPATTPTPSLTPTPFFTGTPSPACGQLLPLLSTGEQTPVDTLPTDATTLRVLRERAPEAALPALLYLLSAPENVGLAAYRLNAPAQGAYLNPDVPMPLASAVKIIHLVAYAEAVAAAELNPLETVALADLEAYYLPGLDLGAHNRAVAELSEEGRTFGTPPQLLLDVVPEMMVRYSSNAATDYLHMRLGQRRIEETAVSLSLTSQTAPCTFLGQFLTMGNYTRRGSDLSTLRELVGLPAEYGRYATLLTDAYSSSERFREEQAAWRQTTRRPNLQSQRYFTANFNAQGSAADYARLMATIAGNGLSSGEASFLVRRYLEWPMQFADNQELFTNLGYKNGSMPGVLTTVYYAYPQVDPAPVVVVLFFRDLPNRTYREWRSSLAHDELARWLLADPEAIPLLRDALE